MTTNKMPTVEEIRAMADHIRIIRAGPDGRKRLFGAEAMLLTIADHISKSGPVSEVGRIVIERDDTNQWGKRARIWYSEKSMDLPIGDFPLYTTPPADVEDARRAIKVCKELLYSLVEFDGVVDGQLFNAAYDAIDAAMNGDGHENKS